MLCSNTPENGMLTSTIGLLQMTQRTDDSQGVKMSKLIALAGEAGPESSIVLWIKDGDDLIRPTHIPVANIVAYREDRLVATIPGHTTPSTIMMKVVVEAAVTAGSD